VTDAEEKKLLLGFKKKSNSELNRILNEPFVPPKFKDEAGRILDERFEADPEFKKHVREQQAELVKKKINAKPNGIKIMDAEKTIKGMQIRRNKRRKEFGL